MDLLNQQCFEFTVRTLAHIALSPLYNQNSGRAVGPRRCSSVKAQQLPPQEAYVELKGDWRRPICSPLTGTGHSVCVALGKFDAMHIGHRLLVEEAARMGGYPCLLSFWGMAEVRPSSNE